MGDYVYKVTGKKVTLPDGRKANVATFAYKPFYARTPEDQKRINKMYYNSGCYGADRYVKNNPNYTGLVVIDEYVMEVNVGSFSDGWFLDNATKISEKV